ncbi:MAG: DUF1573 domain-containing protein [Bacteroidia bacterium]
MKKTILSIGLLLCVAVGANAQETTTPNAVNPNAPKFKFESEVVDYGTVAHNADGNREFKFTNVGKEPLIISNAVGSCGCTTPLWPKEPIKPGGTGIIKVHYATDRVGAFEKTVTLTSNAETPSKVLKIKGTVNPDPTPATPPTAPTPAAGGK